MTVKLSLFLSLEARGVSGGDLRTGQDNSYDSRWIAKIRNLRTRQDNRGDGG